MTVGSFVGETARRLLFVTVLLRQTLQLFKKDQRAVRRDLKPLAAALARHVVIDANEMVFDLVEQRSGPRVSARRNLRFPCAPYPSNRVVVHPTASRALKPCRALLGLLGKELPLVHSRRVHDVRREPEAYRPRAASAMVDARLWPSSLIN